MAEQAANGDALQAMAEEIFNLSLIAWQIRQHSKDTGGWDLTETEYLALDLLSRQQPLYVGQLQRQIGVLPAQMSRIIRSLESKFDHPLIACEINPDDKRKIDVSLTPIGEKAHREFRDARMSFSMKILAGLSRQDAEDFMRVMSSMRKTMADAIPADG